MDYEEAIDWLYATQLFGIKLGLEGTQRLFDSLDLFTQLKNRTIVHVAGTNGKGSVCAMVDSIARTSGKRSGLFTSPHLICFRERIRIDGHMISEAEVANILTELRDQVTNWEDHPTFFELTLTLAVKYFCQQNVEVLVMETGMGGRLDATNVLPSSVSVISSIGLDHQQWLGEDIRSVAKEKAGIIKNGIPVITNSCQDQQVLDVLQQHANRSHAQLHLVQAASTTIEFALKGPHQRLNASLAISATKVILPGLTEKTIEKGLSEVNWPGRFDCREGKLIIDGAHNPAAMTALVATWIEEFGRDQKATVIFAATDSKEVATMLSKLSVIAASFVFVKLSAKRGLGVSALTTALQQSEASHIPYHSAIDVGDALQQPQTPSDPILVTGSLFLAGEVLSHCQQQAACFETSEQ